mgnify:FL=1
MLTIKSDDIKGREEAYQAIIWDRKIKKPFIPESFNVLMNEIRGLGFDFRLVSSAPDVTRPRPKPFYRPFKVDHLAPTRIKAAPITDAAVDETIKDLMN